EKCVGHREYAANKYDQPDNWRHGIVPRKYSHSAILSQVVHTSQRFSVELSVGNRVRVHLSKQHSQSGVSSAGIEGSTSFGHLRDFIVLHVSNGISNSL